MSASSSTPILALPTAAEIAQLDPATLAAMPAVAYDLKRLKVYSSCLRCRAKKVKCDRKEPCSRCEKHNVECSYRELASVQLDIRQFQRHLNNPKVRKDGAGIITSTATPIIVSSSSSSCSSPTASSSDRSSSLLVTVASERAAPNNVTCTPLSKSTSAHSPEADDLEDSPLSANSSCSSTPRRPNKAATNPAMARAKVTKLVRKKKTNSSLSASSSSDNLVSPAVSDKATFAHYPFHHMVSDETTSASPSHSHPNSDTEMDPCDDVPIWRARPMGRHHQTPQEQDLAETFGLAAYLKAKEESVVDPQQAGQNIAYEVELERALALRLPSSFSRSSGSDRAKPYARPASSATAAAAAATSRPSHCQYPPGNHTASSWANATEKSSLYHASFPATPIAEAAPQATQCCCQIAARNGQAPGTCYYANSSHSHGPYEYGTQNKHEYDYRYEHAESREHQHQHPLADQQALAYEDDGHTARIQYSPSYSPSYNQQHGQQQQDRQQSPPVAPPRAAEVEYGRVANYGHHHPTVKQEAPVTPTASFPPTPSASAAGRYFLPELPSTLPAKAPTTSDLSAFQVGRDKTIKIACKYNEPNVDAWDMIEQPLPLPLPRPSQASATGMPQQSRSIKMEMGWILS